MDTDIPTTRLIIATAAAGLAVVQVVSFVSGATAESAALRGVVALVGVSAFGLLAQRFLAAPIDPEPSDQPTLGAILDVRSGPDDDQTGVANT